MKSFKQNLTEQTFDSFLSLNEEDFDKFLETLSDEELNELEEGIVSGIAKGVAAVGKGAYNLAKKAVVNKQGNVRVSTAGRADAADAKLAKIKKKQADRERLKKAQAGIDAEKAKMKADREKEKSESVEVDEKSYTPMQVKQAVGIASDKRYAGGNMSGAVRAIEKLAKGLSNHKQVAAVLKRQNESRTIDQTVSDVISGRVRETVEVEEVNSLEESMDIITFNSNGRNVVETITDLLEDGYSQVPTGDGTDLALNDIKNPDSLQQLNALVGAVGIREYVNPKGALVQLQGKLATLGLTFDIPAMTEDKGTASTPLTQYGGITGKSVSTAIDALDSENPAEGLNLQIEYEKTPFGTTKVYAKIV
jgi:hypothetical protein